VEWSGQPRRAGPAPSAAAALSKIVAQTTAGSVQEQHPQRRRRGLFVEPDHHHVRSPGGATSRRWSQGMPLRTELENQFGTPGATKMPPLTGLGPPRMANAPHRYRPDGAGGFGWLRGATKIALLRSGAVHAAGQTTKAERCCVASHQAHQGPCHARASAVRRGIVVEGRGPSDC
jgi:hypothetical protein